jgi:hypothetical protein
MGGSMSIENGSEEVLVVWLNQLGPIHYAVLRPDETMDCNTGAIFWTICAEYYDGTNHLSTSRCILEHLKVFLRIAEIVFSSSYLQAFSCIDGIFNQILNPNAALSSPGWWAGYHHRLRIVGGASAGMVLSLERTVAE